MRQKDAEYLEQQVDEGHVVLFVRVLDAERERRAVEILAKHSNFDVKVCTVADVAPETAAAAKS